MSAAGDKIVQAQNGERERLARMPGRCSKCGEYMETDRNEHATTCLRCYPYLSVVAKVVGEFAYPGVWRIGPVTFDWSGAMSVAHCSACSFSIWRWDERVHRTAINHAKYWHGVNAKPHRILAPMHAIDCAQPDCINIVATSEDFPGVMCAEHRDPERRAA